MKKIFNAMLSAFLWVGAALGVVTVSISIFSLLGLVQPLVVATGSMSPAFDAGSFILSVQKPASEVKVGDIITVPRNDGVLVTHRAYEVDPPNENGLVSIIMKGDANKNKDIDPYIVTEVGHPIVIVPYAGSVIAALNNFKFIIISLLAGVVMIWVIWGKGSKPADEPKKSEEKPERKKGNVLEVAETTEVKDSVANKGEVNNNIDPV